MKSHLFYSSVTMPLYVQLSAQIAEAIGRIDLNVDFSESNLYSVKPMDKAPDECPYTEFTVIVRTAS